MVLFRFLFSKCVLPLPKRQRVLHPHSLIDIAERVEIITKTINLESFADSD